VSVIYPRRHEIDRDDNWFMLKLQEEAGELTQAFLMRAGQARDKGQYCDEIESMFRCEWSDVLAQVLLMARFFNVDLQAQVERRWLVWNPEWPGGRTGHRGSLSRTGGPGLRCSIPPEAWHRVRLDRRFRWSSPTHRYAAPSRGQRELGFV
jgi:NTP pyrophosphatase (non-canonical NTP hydrolase)